MAYRLDHHGIVRFVQPLPCCVCGENGGSVRVYRWYEEMIKRAIRLKYKMVSPQQTHLHQGCADTVQAWLRGSKNT